MAIIPQEVKTAWEDQASAPIFSTTDTNGLPNSVYATSIRILDDSTMVVADNYFGKTRANILDGSTGSILFITSEKKAYQIKGTLVYESEGKYFDFMKSWNPDRLPGLAAVALKVESIYTGSTKLA